MINKFQIKGKRGVSKYIEDWSDYNFKRYLSQNTLSIDHTPIPLLENQNIICTSRPTIWETRTEYMNDTDLNNLLLIILFYTYRKLQHCKAAFHGSFVNPKLTPHVFHRKNKYWFKTTVIRYQTSLKFYLVAYIGVF